MAGSVASVESPEVYNQPISRTPQQFIDASHRAGCRTLFRAGSGTDATGTEHVPIGYFGERGRSARPSPRRSSAR
jgi:hypothetical protein